MELSKMQYSTATPPYDLQAQPKQHLPSFKHLFESIIIDDSSAVAMIDNQSRQPLSPPDLLHDDDDDSDSSPSRSLSPRQSSYNDHDMIFTNSRKNTTNKSLSDSLIKPLASSSLLLNSRRKSVPYKSPTSVTDNSSIVFQLSNHFDFTAANQSLYPDCGDACDTSTKIICGQSLLSKLRKRVKHARNLIHLPSPPRMTPRYSKRGSRAPSIIEIPQLVTGGSNSSASSVSSVADPEPSRSWMTNDEEEQEEKFIYQPTQNQQSRKRQQHHDDDENDMKRVKKSTNDTYSRRTSSSGAVAGRPSRVKGPCQACNEASDGCMRKAFNWPFPASQVFSDKGKPFVYLCNKCGLRYNKSGGCVCRHCRWVFCKEEKRKALQHIEVMRLNRPDGYVDPEEEIENFLCSPKYWTCGRKWKVGWVLNNDTQDFEEAETSSSITTIPSL